MADGTSEPGPGQAGGASVVGRYFLTDVSSGHFFTADGLIREVAFFGLDDEGLVSFGGKEAAKAEQQRQLVQGLHLRVVFRALGWRPHCRRAGHGATDAVAGG